MRRRERGLYRTRRAAPRYGGLPSQAVGQILPERFEFEVEARPQPGFPGGEAELAFDAARGAAGDEAEEIRPERARAPIRDEVEKRRGLRQELERQSLRVRHVGLLARQSDGAIEAAELVDEAGGQSVVAGPDPSGGNRLDGGALELSPLCDVVEEATLDLVDPFAHARHLALVEGGELGEEVGVRAAL